MFARETYRLITLEMEMCESRQHLPPSGGSTPRHMAQNLAHPTLRDETGSNHNQVPPLNCKLNQNYNRQFNLLQRTTTCRGQHHTQQPRMCFEHNHANPKYQFWGWTCFEYFATRTPTLSVACVTTPKSQPAPMLFVIWLDSRQFDFINKLNLVLIR